jgi:glycosyltransferase involved in cell wall biosynthesis
VNHPRISVVIPTRDRDLRLRWLLEALAEQTLPRDLYEVIVVDDGSTDSTGELLQQERQRDRVALKVVSRAVSAGPAAARNAGWRAARAPVVVFTDDDCRPPSDWLATALQVADRHPDAVIQGTTLPDPEEEAVRKGSPHSRWVEVHPPTVWAETCNIVYPRERLEQLGGFDENIPQAGDDTDLLLRAIAAGVNQVAAPEVLTYHGVMDGSLFLRLRSSWRWQDLAYVVKRHPELRDHLPLWIFWKRRHVWFPAAVTGAALQRRHPAWALLAIPWLLHALPDHGSHPRGRLRSLSEIPGRVVVDAAEIAALARGSIRHRTVLL